MRVICAWCGQPAGIRCEHCNDPLIHAQALGGTFGLWGDVMICLAGPTPLVYSHESIEKMDTTHGMCQKCAALPEETRDALLIERRREKRILPSAADLDAIVREQQIREATRQKRGPTEVTKSATTHAPRHGEKP
jgi:hypothetical protein